MTDPTSEPLADDAVDRRGKDARLDVHVSQPLDCRSRSLCVQGREHEVPCHRGAECDLSGFFVANLAEDYCFIVIAGDFIGLTSRDLPLAPLAVNDVNRTQQVTEKLAQSVVDFMALESVARGPMANAPEFELNGASVIDPARTFYVGGSLGGIMGNVIMAYDPNLMKGVLAADEGTPKTK